ncbi:DUF2560 family protein [Serratia marcescens]|uniref:DUF2560 family protein n=1 Tax=Serratia marcescens TaxID=615 RepID=UPI000669B083|nr:DUF2560 family protein [Serratia marcescens]AVE48218.1 DUF2560 domain-containing protein [Serratia marcescens]MBH2973992.1 DUF2560 family protein [Serratia marcescens]MBH2978663.1 DUF2560 family protein [Serratia marcescens]MBN5326382.1 DUF2560 family protein [Serratia marcescens]MBN5348773.1 DUF2560 family protein [Serratia marcescens]
MAELTDQQKLRLSILSLVQNDTAAAQEAIDYIADDSLKLELELFNRQYALAQAEQTPLTRTIKAIQGVKDALPLFQ